MQESFTLQVDPDIEPLWPLDIEPESVRGLRRMVLAVAVGVGFGLLAAASRFLAPANSHIFVFSAADGTLAAFLLSRRKQSWWIFLLSAWLGGAISILAALHGGVGRSVGLAFSNCLAVLLAVLPLQRAVARHRDLVSSAILTQFLVYAVVLGPAISGVVAAVGYHFALGGGVASFFKQWFPSCAVGMAMTLPSMLAASNPQLGRILGRERMYWTVGSLVLMTVASFVVFDETRYSLVFLLLPPFVMVASQAGIAGSVVATLEVFVVGTFYTLRGYGPYCLDRGRTPESSMLLLQMAALVMLVSIVPFAVAIERQRGLRARLRLDMKRYQLLADNSRDIVVLSNLEGQRLYVSPAVREVLGWTQQEWAHGYSVDLMHPKDRAPFRRLLKEMLRGEDRRSFRYRTQHKNGRYVWMEANLRTVLDEATGHPEAFVANVRDISGQVEAEEKLAEAHEHVQQQAQRDSLTQLASRRRFDEALDQEWRRGRRTANPLALVRIEIDDFKRIGDTYGQRAGDHCLQNLAAILAEVARRPGDIAARYGLDEFALLLPDVDLDGARLLAGIFCRRVREHLFDAGIGATLKMTVTIGVAALVPDTKTRVDALVEAVEESLSAARMAGRNRTASQREEDARAQLVCHLL